MEIATQKEEFDYTSRIIKTNCIDKVHGHSYQWIFGKEAEKIRKAHPKLKPAIIKCTKCGKINQSM